MPNHDLSTVGLHSRRLSYIASANHASSSHRTFDRALKRGFDLGISLLAVALLLPIFVLVGVSIWMTDRGSPFYSHRRLGRGQRSFACLKFRTMRVDSQDALAKHLAANPSARVEWARERKLKNDPRITPLGRALRRSSLDELPQLINVIRGEMSIVGPRPIVDDEIEKYGDAAAAYFTVRPGLTGAWQVSGRSDTTYAERVHLDRRYVESRTFVGDIVIVLRTIPAVFLLKGSC